MRYPSFGLAAVCCLHWLPWACLIRSLSLFDWSMLCVISTATPPWNGAKSAQLPQGPLGLSGGACCGICPQLALELAGLGRGTGAGRVWIRRAGPRAGGGLAAGALQDRGAQGPVCWCRFEGCKAAAKPGLVMGTRLTGICTSIFFRHKRMSHSDVI